MNEYCTPNNNHHWILDTPDGKRWVWAQCRNCGNFRLFATALPHKVNWQAAGERRKKEEVRRLRRLEKAKVPFRQFT